MTVGEYARLNAKIAFLKEVATEVENSGYCNCISCNNTYDTMLCRICVCTIYDRLYEIIN